MNARRLLAGLSLFALCLGASAPALALANRVFVSARSGNNGNSCDNILTPCQSFAGAVLQLNPNGEMIVLDSGGYGAVTITQGVTIDAPAGVTAFIHPASGDAITVNAGSAVVTLRGLTLNGGTGNGITVASVGTLNVVNCSISGFASDGIAWNAAGRLNLKGVDVTGCGNGVLITNTTGQTSASVDHCHFDGNGNGYFMATTTLALTSTTTATNSTANNNSGDGWVCGGGTGGTDLLLLESCSGSANAADGLFSNSSNPDTAARFSNCSFASNGSYGIENGAIDGGVVETRGNNNVTSNGSGPTKGLNAYSPI